MPEQRNSARIGSAVIVKVRLRPSTAARLVAYARRQRDKHGKPLRMATAAAEIIETVLGVVASQSVKPHEPAPRNGSSRS